MIRQWRRPQAMASTLYDHGSEVWGFGRKKDTVPSLDDMILGRQLNHPTRELTHTKSHLLSSCWVGGNLSQHQAHVAKVFAPAPLV